MDTKWPKKLHSVQDEIKWVKKMSIAKTLLSDGKKYELVDDKNTVNVTNENLCLLQNSTSNK